MKRAWEISRSRSGSGTIHFLVVYYKTGHWLLPSLSACPFVMGLTSFFHYEINYIFMNLKFGLGYCFFFFNQGTQIRTWKSNWALGFTFFCCSWKLLLCEVPGNLLNDEWQKGQSSPWPQVTAKQLPEVDPKMSRWGKKLKRTSQACPVQISDL